MVNKGLEMEKTILVAGDDEELLSMLSEYSADGRGGAFLIINASNGEEAAETLKKDNISLVITALAMPKVDGLVLLDYMAKCAPAVPCIVVADESTSGAKQKAIDLGAIDFLEKPLNYKTLNEKIIDIFHGQEDGGFLRDAALEIFAHIVQMESKTCTIRTMNMQTGLAGSLLFKNGELYDAACAGLNGLEAAYEIFTWGKLNLSIQNSCHLKENRINTPLQGVLLEAMRLKDEKEREGQKTDISAAKEDISVQPDKTPEPETVYGSIISEVEEKKDALNISETGAWDELMQLAEDIGSFFETGPLRICSLSDGKGMALLLVAGKSNLAVKQVKKME
jgi:CheY-like chemotaxis protein